MLTENYVKAGNVMENKYSRLQISIHWLVFLLVIAAYCAMEFRGFFPRSDQYSSTWFMFPVVSQFSC